jgi:glycosyltransferase involved in cell wall biosynthesis
VARVSVVIPALDEGERLPALLDGLAAAAAVEVPATEFVVVDDGSAPEHRQRERAAAEAASRRLVEAGLPHRVRFLASERNRGKGAAIRLGWAEADPAAEWLGFLDADGAISPAEAWRLVRRAASADDLDLLCGSRIKMAGRHIERRAWRHFQGRIFATLSERLLRLGFYDTQCGVKLARASLLRPRLPLLAEDRWLLDLELIAILRGAGARCREEPIDWVDQARSKVVFGIDALRMGLGILRLRRRLERNGLLLHRRGWEARSTP